MADIEKKEKEIPDVVRSCTYRIRLGCRINPLDDRSEQHKLYLTVCFLDGKPFRIIPSLGKGGGCESSVMWGVCESISVGLEAGADPRKFIKRLTGIQCPYPSKWGPPEQIKGRSCAEIVAKVLMKVCGVIDENSRH